MERKNSKNLVSQQRAIMRDCGQRWARSPAFRNLEDQRSNHLNTVILKIKIVILKIKITLLLVLKER